MSNYHHNEFLGFGACAPPNFIPDFIYSYLFFPPQKTSHGQPETAPYGLRKTESQLFKEGFNVTTVDPKFLGKFLGNTKVLGIHTMDPFGLGPASSTFASILKKTPFLAQHFESLLASPEVRQAKKNGLKIIVGGPGAWQFPYRPNFLNKSGIDCIVEGESENVIGKIFKAALEGQELPKHYKVDVSDTPSIDQIPDIIQPSVNGLVEIGRGCCRGCKFCNTTLRPLRWFPVEKIKREINVNLNSGKVNGACLHAEDVMLYGSNNTTPDEKKLLHLHSDAIKNCDSISWSHCSLAAVAANPKLFHAVSEIILEKQSWWGAEIGLETGSPEIAKKIMPAKAHPFKAEDWQEVVHTGLGLMHDNKLVPAATLIVGLPEEREEDIIKTMELLDDIKDYRSLIVPLYFVPLGRFHNKDWFNQTKLNDEHVKLMFKCAEHDFRWIDDLLNISFDDKWYGGLLRRFYRGFSYIAKRKVRQIE